MSKAIGLDIGTSAVRAVQLSAGRRGAPTLERLGQVMLPFGAIRDGEVQDPDAVSDALRLLWSRYNLKGKEVALGLANQQVVVRQVDLPYLPDDELRESLEFQVADYIPIPVEQALLDFHTVEHYENESGERFSRVLLVAAQRAMVDTYLAAVRAAKLEPVLVDLDAFALLRTLAPEGGVAAPGGELLIDVGASVTNIVVHEGGVPRFVRILLMGGNTITESLIAALGISHEQAEQAKLSASLGQPGDNETNRLVVERANRFVDEIRGSLDFYAAQADSVPVGRIVLTGGGSRLAGLADRLGAVLHLPVEHSHHLQHLDTSKAGLDDPQLAEAEPFLAVAIGLALGVAT